MILNTKSQKNTSLLYKKRLSSPHHLRSVSSNSLLGFSVFMGVFLTFFRLFSGQLFTNVKNSEMQSTLCCRQKFLELLSFASGCNVTATSLDRYYHCFHLSQYIPYIWSRWSLGSHTDSDYPALLYKINVFFFPRGELHMEQFKNPEYISQ